MVTYYADDKGRCRGNRSCSTQKVRCHSSRFLERRHSSLNPAIHPITNDVADVFSAVTGLLHGRLAPLNLFGGHSGVADVEDLQTREPEAQRVFAVLGFERVRLPQSRAEHGLSRSEAPAEPILSLGVFFRLLRYPCPLKSSAVAELVPGRFKSSGR